MGQLLLLDNLPNIVVASTTSVTLATTNQGQTTTVTIGGQQYSLSSTLMLNTGSTGANGLDTGSLGAIQLWYVYAIANSSTFVPALIASQTGPSTGPSIPSGYFAAYKLVGAFYTNGSSQVGVTVPLTGPAVTAEMSWTPTGTWTTNTTYTGLIKRNGGWADFQCKLALAGAPTATALVVSLPSGIVIDTTRLIHTTGNDTISDIGRSVAKCAAFSAAGVIGNIVYRTTGDILPRWLSANNTGNKVLGANFDQIDPGTFASGDLIELYFSLPIVGWNATLL